MNERVKDVVILGGGTAGWMTAAYLGKALQGSAKITVLEAPTVPTIGVGEATVPNLHRAFFAYLGIPEDEWMREVNASFKIAVKFINWRTPGDNHATPQPHNGFRDQFFHPFGLLPDVDQIPLSHYWAQQRLSGQTDEQFDYACFREPAIMDGNLAPRTLDGTPVTRYAWHFNASLLADFLRRFATQKQGVIHVEDKMTKVDRDANGFVTALHTETGKVLNGDLFIDCSGFRSLLMNVAMEEPFIDMSDHLLCDSAVATAVPHDDVANGVEPYTSAIAMKSGWTWRIPMLGRFGSGYVFSSQFVSRDEATKDFADLWGLDPENTQFNQIKFRVGRNRRSWVKNVVGVGLSSCFLEPLESTGIYFIYSAIYQLVKHFPDRGFNPVLADQFNKNIEEMFDSTRDFIQAHFYLSPRTDTPFWQANKELELAEGIKEKIAMYKAGLSINAPTTDESNYYGNFEAEFKNFWTNGSYYCIFAGMGLLPDHPLPILAHKPASVGEAELKLAEIKQKQQEIASQLPSNYEFLTKLHGTST